MTGTPMKIPTMDPNKPFVPQETPPSSQNPGNPTPAISKEPPADPVIDPNAPPAKTPEQLQIEEYQRKEQAYLQRQRDQDAKLTQLTSVVEKLVIEKSAPPPKTPEEEAKDFYRDPRKVIREVMEETVKPLNEFKDSFQSNDAYTRVKNQFRSDPRFAPYFQRQGFEQTVDAVVNQAAQSGTQISEAFVESALTHTAGQIAVGTIQMPDPIADANVQNTPPQPGVAPVDNRQIPPYLQPSAPPSVQRTPDGPKRRALTENEDRIRRENGQSVEDWWEFMEMPSTGVIDSKVGLPKGDK